MRLEYGGAHEQSQRYSEEAGEDHPPVVKNRPSLQSDQMRISAQTKAGVAFETEDGQAAKRLMLLPRNRSLAATNGKKRKKVQRQSAGFIVPKSVCQLRLDELPITKRLANIVRSAGILTLGDLNGRSVCELLQLKNCGWRTIGEVQQLIERAISGEFDTKQIDESAVAVELLTLLEQGMLRLPPRKNQFLFARLGGLSFAEIGRQYGVTRAGAHLIFSKAVETLKKTYGSRIPRLLEIVKRHSLSTSNASGLTSALLEQWIGVAAAAGDCAGPAVAGRLSREAQLRLIASLDKNIHRSLEI